VHRADHVAIRFLQRGEAVTAEARYGDLAQAVSTMAAGLYRAGLSGTPVVLALPPGLDFSIALLACLRAGAIAAPIPYPPQGQEAKQRLTAMLGDLGTATVLGTGDPALDGVGLRRIDPAELDCAPLAMPFPAPDAPAVIQYSSGSTRTPRGIVISHANIVANQHMIREMFDSGPDTIALNWLPPHHDMGLFGALLHPLFLGGTAILMPPMAFIQRPIRWLEAISHHHATIAGAPNFGYDLCVRRVSPDQAATLDLSSLTVTFCGAEPVRAASLTNFAAHFASSRFDPASYSPCYGLAEATLLAASTLCGAGVRTVVRDDGHRHIACGIAPSASQMRICDPQDGHVLPPGKTGEICLAGPHVAIGVWHGASGTVAPMPELYDEDGTSWLRTGDLGVLGPHGLVIHDRIKDLIIVHGRNIYATDAEAIAMDVAGASLQAVAAVALNVAADERLLLLCEVPRAHARTLNLDALAESIARSVAEGCGALPEVAFVAAGALPRTTSGKIRRQAARQAYHAQTLRRLAGKDAQWANA
jgi:acyl-CoA synthetase (AMP-forming)/AMP-acid ligase II